MKKTLKIFTWLFGLLILAIGIINTFWGNDPFYGVFVILTSLIYFQPISGLIEQKMHFKIPPFVKIVLGIFILWSALGVAELFDKIDLMLENLLFLAK